MGEKNYKYRKNTKKMENCLRRNTQGEAIRKRKNTNCHECTVLTTDSINVQRLTVTTINSVHIPAIKIFVCVILYKIIHGGLKKLYIFQHIMSLEPFKKK